MTIKYSEDFSKLRSMKVSFKCIIMQFSLRGDTYVNLLRKSFYENINFTVTGIYYEYLREIRYWEINSDYVILKLSSRALL